MSTMPPVPDTDYSRRQLADLVTTAADAWRVWAKGRDLVDTAWRALYTTPDDRFRGAVLALMDTHAGADVAARTWDRCARELLTYTLADPQGNVTTWRDMADTMAVDTTGWEIGTLTDYPPAAGPGGLAPGPAARAADETRRTHEDRLARLARLVPTGTPLEGTR